MTTYGQALHQDGNGVTTSAQYGDRGDGTSTWFLPAKVYNGGDVAQGSTTDVAVTNPASSASVIAALKGLLSLLPVATSSSGVSAIANGSGNVAAATAAATLVAGGAGKTTYVTKVHITGGGAIAASIVTLTITGLVGGTRTYNVPVPAGATAALSPVTLDFGDAGFPASAANTSITVSLASLGAGNTNASVNVYGFVK